MSKVLFEEFRCDGPCEKVVRVTTGRFVHDKIIPSGWIRLWAEVLTHFPEETVGQRSPNVGAVRSVENLHICPDCIPKLGEILPVLLAAAPEKTFATGVV